MTNCRQDPRREEALNDYVDGLLDDARRAELERHLEGCEDCRATLEELRDLLERAAELKELPPSTDLFPRIRARVSRRRPDWRKAAVAAVLVIGLAGLAAVMLRGGSGDAAPDREPAAAAVLAEYRAAEQQYLEATERLLALLEQRRGEIPPEALQVVEENLGIIDDAIGRARLAFETDGAEARDAHVLTALYDKKLQLLWRASQLAIEG